MFNCIFLTVEFLSIDPRFNHRKFKLNSLFVVLKQPEKKEINWPFSIISINTSRKSINPHFRSLDSLSKLRLAITWLTIITVPRNENERTWSGKMGGNRPCWFIQRCLHRIRKGSKSNPTPLVIVVRNSYFEWLTAGFTEARHTRPVTSEKVT